jgi:hypothetical protein
MKLAVRQQKAMAMSRNRMLDAGRASAIQAGNAALGADQRQGALHDGDKQGEDEDETADFRDHGEGLRAYCLRVFEAAWA